MHTSMHQWWRLQGLGLNPYSYVHAGTRERYQGSEHGVENMVEKTKLEVVCFRCVLGAQALSSSSDSGLRLRGRNSCFVSSDGPNHPKLVRQPRFSELDSVVSRSMCSHKSCFILDIRYVPCLVITNHKSSVSEVPTKGQLIQSYYEASLSRRRGSKSTDRGDCQSWNPMPISICEV